MSLFDILSLWCKELELSAFLFRAVIVITFIMDRSVSFRDIQNVEEESTSGRTSTSNLSSMFADNNVHSLNHASIEAIESQPQAAWKLPAISPNQVYNDLSMFHLRDVSRVIVK